LTRRQNIYWVDVNRFDIKPDKSTWLEMGETLNRHGFIVRIVTSFAEAPYVPKSHDVEFSHLKPSRIPGLFRLTFLIRATFFLVRHRDRNAIYILSPAALFIIPALKAFGLHNIHLDVRSPPVGVRGWKKRLDSIIFWHLALKIFTPLAKSYSFITFNVRQEVERVSNRQLSDSCIWSSGVRCNIFSVSQVDLRESLEYDFFYHGTITVDRGIFTMVKAASSLATHIRKHVLLTIVGAGPDTPKLVQLIDSEGWGDFVNYLGFVPYEEIPMHLKKADCCICPLPDRKEWQMSSPLKIFEYMAAAKPIIATPIAAHSNVLDGCPFVMWTNGFDERAIAGAMVQAYENRVTLAHAAAGAPKIVRANYDWELIGRSFAEHLNSCYE